MNNSPWLHHLNRTRPIANLDGDHKTEVAIIGGGIAGIATAYYTLKNTKAQVTLIEADKIAHGATGHNGGFLATYFERSFSSLVGEFGLKTTAKAQKDIESAWELLDEIKQETNLRTPIWQFTGYTACVNIEEVLIHLRNSALRLKAGLPHPLLMLSKEVNGIQDIPDIYKDLYTIVSKQEILALLETEDKDYIAIVPEKKGCMNSAVFCEELINYLLKKYSTRFTLAEHTPVKRLVLKKEHAILNIPYRKKIIAKKVILCTNGFEKITIINLNGPPIDKKFHHLIRGIVGYMAGYTEELNKQPAQISYLPKNPNYSSDVYTESPYFYLTRRPFDTEGKQALNLICVGGPEALMDDTNNYNGEHPYPQEAREQIDSFLRFTYKHGPKDKVKYKFLWHGLMGFTPNGVRLIGPEPCNPILYYNLGCNGVGLLPSIFGGLKISRHLAGKKVSDSIFDPKDARRKPRRHAKKTKRPIPREIIH